LSASELIHVDPPDDADAVDERREAIVRVVSDALHELGNALGVARHFAEHAESVPGPDAVAADLEEIRRALQRATAVTRSLGETVRHEGRPRAGVAVPAVAARAAERLRRAGVDEVSLVISPADDLLIVPTAREHTLESMVCAMAGLGRPASSVHIEVSSRRDGDGAFGARAAGVSLRVVRDRSNPGDDRESRNADVTAGLVGGRMSFHPDPWEWYEAEVLLPAAFSVVGPADARPDRGRPAPEQPRMSAHG
jgi:signal transduction histidine kinase